MRRFFPDIFHGTKRLLLLNISYPRQRIKIKTYIFIPLILPDVSLNLRTGKPDHHPIEKRQLKMDIKCSGVILAGGENKRFLGKNKALCLIEGKRIIDRIYSVFRSIFDEIILVTNAPELYPDMDAFIVTDIYPKRSSMTGIHSGLFYASNPYVFCSACDTPFLKKEVVQCVLSHIRPHFDLILPETSAGLEPLCAVYARNCIGLLEQNILADRFKIQRAFNEKRILKIPESVIRQHDPDLSSFFNVNCREDLSAAWEMAVHG